MLGAVEKARLKAAIVQVSRADGAEGVAALFLLRGVAQGKSLGCGAEALLEGATRVKELLEAVLPFVQAGENDRVMGEIDAELEAEDPRRTEGGTEEAIRLMPGGWLSN
jgi:hypothetical protein